MNDIERILFRAHIKKQVQDKLDSRTVNECTMDQSPSNLHLLSPMSDVKDVCHDDEEEEDVFFGPVSMAEQCLRRINGMGDNTGNIKAQSMPYCHAKSLSSWVPCILHETLQMITS